jgi:hypothetical protein
MQHFGGLLHAQPAEKAQLNHPAFVGQRSPVSLMRDRGPKR